MARRIVAARVTKKPGVAGRMRPMLILLGWGRKLNERLWVMGGALHLLAGTASAVLLPVN